MNNDINREVNSDQRLFKKPTSFSDSQPGWVRKLESEIGLTQQSKKQWEFPRNIRLEYSRVSDEHKAAERRRMRNTNKNKTKRGRY